MNDNCLLRGVIPAIVTPLNDDSTVRVNAVAPVIRFLLDKGADGFYVLGGTGEGAVISENERMRMTEAVAEAARGSGKRFTVHVGAADTSSALRLARHAASAGADVISSVFPNFFLNYNIDEAERYFDSLVQASGLPMLCYCTPMLRSEDVVSFVKRLMSIEGVIGIKYTFPDYYQLQKIKQLNNGNINVINGKDETLICGLSMGADGGIGSSYNVIPQKFVRLYNSFKANDLSAAMEEQRSINRVIDVILQYGIIPTVKLAMEFLGFSVGNAAHPGHRFSKEERDRVFLALTQAGVFS